MGIIGSARNRDRRKSTAYCSRAIRRHRFVRSTAKIKIPPDHSPQKTNIIQALICVLVTLYSFLYYPLLGRAFSVYKQAEHCASPRCVIEQTVDLRLMADELLGDLGA
jgi:hypothetical protein